MLFRLFLILQYGYARCLGGTHASPRARTLVTHESTKVAAPGTRQMISSFRVMWRIGFLITCVIILGTVSDAQTVTLTLQEDLSSKLPTGTAFTARDAAGKVYHGHVVTRPARLLLRRGSMRLIFDDPVVPVTPDPEGVFRAGNKMRLLKLGGSLAAAKLADDAVDGAIAASKARYVAIGAATPLLLFPQFGHPKPPKLDPIDAAPRPR